MWRRTVVVASCRRFPGRRFFAEQSLANRVVALRGSAQDGMLMLERIKNSDAGEFSTPAVQVVDQGLEKMAPLSRGSVVHYGDAFWACLMEVDRFWFAVPLRLEGPASAWSSAESSSFNEARRIAACLRRPTPTQDLRQSLQFSVPTGLMAMEILAPLGQGQSMLVCGALGAGKSFLLRDILENAIGLKRFDKIIRASGDALPAVDSSASSEPDTFVDVITCQPSGGPAAVRDIFAAIADAEATRDIGAQTLLVLDTIAPLLHAWQLAVQWAETARPTPLDVDFLSVQRRNFISGLTERAAFLKGGGSLTLIAAIESDALRGVPQPGDVAAEADGEAYELSDFEASGMRASGMERLRRLTEKGIKLTDKILTTIDIPPPNRRRSRAATGVEAEYAMMRELQSLSDGQVILSTERATAGQFPAMLLGATFSRFGLGSTDGKYKELRPQRDVRPPALQAVSAHLRIELANQEELRFQPSDNIKPVDGNFATRMAIVRAALQQPPRSPVLEHEMVAVLLAACSGRFDVVSAAQGEAALSGGSNSPFLRHLRQSAPQVLESIKVERQLSESTVRELDVAVRLFVAILGPSA